MFSVKTKHPEVFANNPAVADFEIADLVIKGNYPSIHDSSWRQTSYLGGYLEYLNDTLGIHAKSITTHPLIYFSPEELKRAPTIEGRYALLSCQVKNDFKVKNWGLNKWTTVAHWIMSQGIKVVMVGLSQFCTKPIEGTIDMVGKTRNLRDLFLLAYHAEFGCGHESMLHHVFAAFQKPFVCVASDFTGRTYTQYESEQFITRAGTMDCCKTACYRTWVTVPPGVNQRPCKHPDKDGEEDIAACMTRIPAQEVMDAIQAYYLPGGILNSKCT